jgi:putative Mg2+ transporter-C (MgtC) family protein
MIGISTIQFALRLWLAIGMGAMVGLERQWRQRMAGTVAGEGYLSGQKPPRRTGLHTHRMPSRQARLRPMDGRACPCAASARAAAA